MSLTVEDGTSIATAESYISVADADTYHSVRGNTLWATMTTGEKEQSLRRATDYMVGKYQGSWKGVRMKAIEEQALDWPRAFVYTQPFLNGATGDYPYLVADDIVPIAVKNACAELALRAAAGPLVEDLTQRVIEEVIGPIKVKYDPNTPQSVRYLQIGAMLAPYLQARSSSNMMKLGRC